ncbi:MAG: hypothetical protein V4682_02530 [Patescibacteria group bacterium]
MTMVKNEFFDINRFPKDWGIIVMPISMSKIISAQSAEECVRHLRDMLPKISINRVGAHFFYSEGLYMNLEHDAFTTKNNFAHAATGHKRAVQKLLVQHRQKFQIENAISFESWFQMYLSHKSFFNALKAVRDLYESDPEFQKWVAVDAEENGRELTEEQLSFYLEEHLFEYLLMNRQLELHNDFVQGREQWVLSCYPGAPLKAQIYLVQKDPLDINKDRNPYKGQYDLLQKKFVNYLQVDLNTYESQ